MKKFRKISAIVLCVLMVAASCFIANADDVINKGTKGSINIYTYESKKDGKVEEDLPSLQPATGKTMTVPEGYTALAGVKYELYQADGSTKVGEATSATSTGLAQFTNLNQGTYIVKAVSYPKNASGTIKDMKVTIPMTNVERTGIFYDVNVYPKIDTVYGNVEFMKTDAQGTGLKDAKFKLEVYKDGQWVAYDSTVYITGANGKFNISNLPKGDYRLIETASPEGYLLNTTPQTFTIGKEDGEQKHYNEQTKTYEIVKTFVNSNNPTVDKTVADGKKSTDAGVGDDVVWTITPTVPSDIASYKKFNIVDTLDAALTYKSVSVVTGSTTLAKDTDYTVTVTGQKVEVAMTKTGLGKVGADLNVKITTTLNADVNLYTGVANSASLVFKNQFTADDAPDTTIPTDPETDPKVYTGGINFKKTDGASTVLAGAEFKLYKTENDAKNGTNPITFYSKDLKSTTSVATSDSKGEFGFYGLAYGTYYMVETKAPEGYNLKAEVVAIEITASTYAAQATAVTNVKNTQDLPFTGGMGPEIAVVSGVLMMVAAAFVLKKRAR